MDVVQENGDEWTIRCPDPDHDDGTPSASVNVVKGLWCCYSCGKGGRVDHLLDGVRISEPDADENLDEIEKMLAAMDYSRQVYPESWLRQFQVPHPYWESRGFDQGTCSDFNLGYDFASNCCTYPIRDPHGNVLGVTRRRLDGGTPKYKYPSGVDMGKCLFAYERVAAAGCTRIAITEGALDAIALWQVGVPAVAQYGSRLRPAQVNLLRGLGLSSLVLVYDMDKAGRDAADYVINGEPRKRISAPDLGCIIEVARWSSDEAKDAADLDPARRREVVDEAEIAGLEGLTA